MNKNRLIASARNFINNDNLETIINICNLKPLNNDDWKIWVDNEGNKLHLTKTKRIITKKNKYNIKLDTKDIYRKALPESIYRYSYWGLFIIGENKSILNLLGNDGILRSCYIKNGEWKYNFPSSLLGFDILNAIANRYLDEEFAEIKNIKRIYYPNNFKIEKIFSTSLENKSKIEEFTKYVIKR